MEMRY
ncbi:Hypothetical protein EIN_422670, partial [Entamoeba invadens IP1]